MTLAYEPTIKPNLTVNKVMEVFKRIFCDNRIKITEKLILIPLKLISKLI